MDFAHQQTAQGFNEIGILIPSGETGKVVNHLNPQLITDLHAIKR